MRVERRDEVQSGLAELGVLTKPYFPALHLTTHPTPAAGAMSLPVTEALDTEALALPMSSELSPKEALRVAEAVAQVLRVVSPNVYP
jgi:dTDP-4-amino-4,6-dideoxygalactose transaminase